MVVICIGGRLRAQGVVRLKAAWGKAQALRDEPAGFLECETHYEQRSSKALAVSTASNIVEGSARRTQTEYVNFLNIAAGSAAEARYLADVSGRLRFLESDASTILEDGYRELCGSLTALISALSPGP
jgi:four helix bundle protein